MTDTDSLCYHILLPADIVYNKLKNEVPWMDFSNYKTSPFYSHFYSNEKYLIPGYFKDECDGQFLLEFAGK